MNWVVTPRRCETLPSRVEPRPEYRLGPAGCVPVSAPLVPGRDDHMTNLITADPGHRRLSQPIHWENLDFGSSLGHWEGLSVFLRRVWKPWRGATAVILGRTQGWSEWI